MNRADWLLGFILLIAMFISVKAKKLTLAAAITGGILGVLIYIGAGFTGIAMVAAFFVLGTVATSWQMQKKEQLTLAEKNAGRREWTQVIANAGVAALAGSMSYFFPGHEVLWHVLMAASLSSATADTLSSELGNIYGKRYYNILTFKHDMQGENGVVSLEGTLAGVCGSIIIAIIYSIGFTANAYLFFVIVISGTIGNIFDSLLGASFERKQYLSNDAVNFLNTLMAALVAFFLF